MSRILRIELSDDMDGEAVMNFVHDVLTADGVETVHDTGTRIQSNRWFKVFLQWGHVIVIASVFLFRLPHIAVLLLQ